MLHYDLQYHVLISHTLHIAIPVPMARYTIMRFINGRMVFMGIVASSQK